MHYFFGSFPQSRVHGSLLIITLFPNVSCFMLSRVYVLQYEHFSLVGDLSSKENVPQREGSFNLGTDDKHRKPAISAIS